MGLLLALLLLATIIPKSEPAAVDLIVVGDSTAANYTSDPSAFPRDGWAMHLQSFLQQTALVVRDLAVAGTSSKSFIDGKFWAAVKSSYLSPGDFVFVQFGHNDQKRDPLRRTEPFTTFKDYLRIFINDTTQAGANPVLVTPTSRAIWDDNGQLHPAVVAYTEAMRQLAREMHVPLIDLNLQTAQLFRQLGERTTQDTLFMCLPRGKYPNYPEGIHDTIHFQVQGAKVVARLAAQGIIDAHLPITQFVNLHQALPATPPPARPSDNPSRIKPNASHK